MRDRQHSPRKFRKRYIALAIVAVGLAWLGWAVWDALNMKPGNPVGFADRAYEMQLDALGITPKELPEAVRAWEEMVEAFEIVVGAEQEAKARLRGEFPLVDLSFDNVSSGPLMAENAEAVYLEAVRGIDAIRTSGFDEAMDRVLAAPHAIAAQPDGTLREQFERSFRAARVAAQYMVGDMALSMREGDEERFLRQMDRAFALAQRYRHGVSLSHPLVANQYEFLVFREVERQVLSDSVSREGLDRVSKILLNTTISDGRHALATNKQEWLELIEIVYTDDGRGDGRLIVSRAVQVLNSMGATMFEPVVELDGNWAKFGNLSSGFYASKSELIAELDRIYQGLIDTARSLPATRDDKTYDWHRTQAEEESARRYVFIGQLLPILGTFLRDSEIHACETQGLRTLVEVERYRAHRGEYPPSLDALVPDFVEALPIDPYSGKPFVYARVPDGEPYQGRGFILYGVGTDGTDNGGDFSSETSGREWSGEIVRKHCIDWPYHLLNKRIMYGSEGGKFEWTPPPLPADRSGEISSEPEASGETGR